MNMTELVNHLLYVFICQCHTLCTAYTGSLPHKSFVLLRLHRIPAKLPDGIIIKSRHHVKRTVQDILSPDLHLNIPVILIINICALQDLGYLGHFLLLPLICVFDPDAQPGKSILLGNGKIRVCKSYRIDQRIHNRSPSDQAADLFPRIHPVHHRNNHRIICDHIPDIFTYILQRVIFYTDKNIILLSHIANCNDSFRSCNDLTFIITVQHKTIFPDALCSGSTCHHCHMRICFRQHSCHISANTADSDHCNSFLFCLHIICLLFPRISCISAIIKPLSPYNYS